MQDEWDLHERLRLSLGGRADYIHDRLYDSPDVLFSATDSESSAATGHAGLSFEFLDGISFKASAGNSYVAPNIIQLYTFNPRTGFALLGNPRLDPETGYSVDLGLAGEGKGWRAELTAFTSEMRGRLEMSLLLRDFAGGGTRFLDLDGAFSRPDLLDHPKLVGAPTNKWFYHRNLGLVQVQGFEGMAEVSLWRDWTLAGSFNANTQMAELSTGKWLDTAPAVSARLALEKRQGPLEFTLSARYGAAYDTVSRTRPGLPTVRKPDYLVADFFMHWHFLEDTALLLSLKNLFNVAWQQTLDMPESGFAGRAGLELEL